MMGILDRRYRRRLHFEGVPDEAVRKDYDALCSGVAFNVFTDSVGPRNIDYAIYVINAVMERPSQRLEDFFNHLSATFLDR
jgi:hypothetical protein